MQVSLDGQCHSTPRPPKVRLYVDGSRDCENTLGEIWTYIGLLAIPEDNYQSAVELLGSDRLESDCNSEVHFTDLHTASHHRVNGRKALLSARWAKRVMWDSSDTFHFHMLGLHMNRINLSSFGFGSTRKHNAYNRFFRSLMLYSLKSSFKGKAMVTHVFHDIDELRHHQLFNWHAIWRLDTSEPELIFLNPRVEFIESDHRKEQTYPLDSHFIQLCDLLLGGFRHCLDDSNKKDGCCEVAECLLPLVERLVDDSRCNNPNSRFNYANRISVSFFPKQKLEPSEMDNPIARAQSSFYRNRHLLFKERISGQQRFPGF